MKSIIKFSLFGFILAALILIAAPRVTNAAAPAVCSADPSTAVVGTKITITCTGFDRDTWVNLYVVDQTGFSEVGLTNYAACMVNSQGKDGDKGKANENGVVTFYWYTQNGVNTCPTRDYNGYSNQLGTYTVVVHELDGAGGIKYKGTVKITLTGNGKTFKGATLILPASVAVYERFTIVAGGFTPNEYVNIWFTTPGDCSGMGNWYWTGGGALSPYWAEGHGLQGADGTSGGLSTLKADSSGVIAATYSFGDPNPKENEFPCLGTWGVTVNALGSGVGAVGWFQVNGLRVANNASVWTDEAVVPSIGQPYDCNPYGCGVAVHVYGSGFPAGSSVNCWFTRPDGTVSIGYPVTSGVTVAKVDGAGNFNAGVSLTYTSEGWYQGEQPGRWAVTCGTPDGKYSGVAWFWVVPLLSP